MTRPAGVLDDAAQLRAARTDPDAFAAFYVRWAPALHAWLRTQLPADAANEITAETFAQALVSLGRFRGVRAGSGVAWLWGIARNLVRQQHRRARLESSARARLGVAERGYDTGDWDEAEARAGAAALAAELASALGGLSREQRRAVELRIVAELDFGAVCEDLGISEPAARMRVSRALRVLRSRLQGANSMTEPTLAPNLEAILADLMPAAERLAARRRLRARRVRVGAIAAAALAIASPVALAGLTILGEPAPPAVKRDLRAVDRGLPPDLRLNPDVEHARAVAASGDSVVYFAALKDGGYCAELVTADARPRGAVCSTRAQVDETPLAVTIPFSDPVTSDSPVTASGHVAVDGARTVELVYPDGGSDTFPLGERNFYVADVPEQHLAAVHRHGLMLIARDADGRAVAQAVVPMDAITPPSEAERPHDPIEIDTVSTGGDFTRVLRVRGEIHVRGVDRVTLRYPDGMTVPLALSGHLFDYAVPGARQRDLMKPGTVTAWSEDGTVLADRPVAAVAYWEGRER